MRVIVAGSRQLSNYMLVEHACSMLSKPMTMEICGCCRGPDMLGAYYANQRNIPVRRYPAQWQTYGKQAGFKRNEQMAEDAEALVAIWDGVSRGTKHMIDIARKRGLEVIVLNTSTGVITKTEKKNVSHPSA